MVQGAGSGALITGSPQGFYLLSELCAMERNACESSVEKQGTMYQAGGTAPLPMPSPSASFQGNGACSGNAEGTETPGVSTTLPEFESWSCHLLPVGPGAGNYSCGARSHQQW